MDKAVKMTTATMNLPRLFAASSASGSSVGFPFSAIVLESSQWKHRVKNDLLPIFNRKLPQAIDKFSTREFFFNIWHSPQYFFHHICWCFKMIAEVFRWGAWIEREKFCDLFTSWFLVCITRSRRVVFQWNSATLRVPTRLELWLNRDRSSLRYNSA